jgi:hypothetical protein
MTDFSARTGLDVRGDAARRYLWTNAFAVFARLGLYLRTGATEHLEGALRLVDLVHHVLGRHRPDDPRTGWISGLSEAEGERRPTAGGLRIGKPLPERLPGEPIDERLEWERDGQYFHYLTKWMHALSRVSIVTQDVRWDRLAIDLAWAAHGSFVYQRHPDELPRMHWKMSIDLSRPLVPSMGQLDPLDGFVATSCLRATQLVLGSNSDELDDVTADMHRMCAQITTWTTHDPLGIGELLVAAGMLVQLTANGHLAFDDMLDRNLVDADRSLQALTRVWDPRMAPSSRLAFRELGLSIGLRALEPMRVSLKQHSERFGGSRAATALLGRVQSLARCAPLVDQIEKSWLAQAGRREWVEHEDINAVMLANSLLPEVYLLADDLRPPRPRGSHRHTEENVPW